MSNFSVFLIALLFCSVFILSEAQIYTSKECNGSSECYSHCEGITGKRSGKCINKKCVCYR
uniref:Uncharacterized protein n=1 Tax=Isometrus maculatus TaxID=497827 RepID=A0A0U1TYC6_ISOMC|nr:hypothetical protein [Isometrus maculatus]